MHGARVNSERKPGNPEFRVAIVGGGPGGLFSAWNFAAKLEMPAKLQF
jgi:ribulose 1,5-bisphosphate synthetase/thiazole synthase